jgi:short-subunit dehydrogenase
MASAAALYGVPNQSVYGATKAGLRSLTETLDGEWHDDGIKVRSLMPSFIDTPLLDHAPNTGRSASIRETVRAAGLDIAPPEAVAEAAWDAMHGKRLHTTIGKSAKQMRFAVKWMPGLLRSRARKLTEAAQQVEG